MNLIKTFLILTLLNFKGLTFSQTNQSESLSVKVIKTNHDTLVDYNFLSIDFKSSTEVQFNYPKLENKILNKHEIILKNDSITIKLLEKPFDLSKHRLTYDDTLKIPKKYALRLIDDKSFYGTDGELPKSEFDKIVIYKNEKSSIIESNDIKDLYNLNFQLQKTNVYIVNDGRIIITFWASDGAGGYFTVLILRDGLIEKKIIDTGF